MTQNHETFFERLQPFFAPSDLDRIDLAYIIAKDKHRGQYRKDEKDEHGDPVRYFEHVRRAVLIGLDVARIVRLDTTICGFLHDSLEDTRITPGKIENWFGADVCTMVRVLSKVPKEGYLDRFFICTDWRPFFVKGCDRLDNLRTLTNSPVEFRRKIVGETKDKYYRLFDRMVTLTPVAYRDGVRRLRDAIHETTEATSLE